MTLLARLRSSAGAGKPLISASPFSTHSQAARRPLLFLSRWSIRRKLLVCLAIVLGIVAALAYSGFQGAYSYKVLAWTIGVRAIDLKRASEVRESLGDLRV